MHRLIHLIVSLFFSASLALASQVPLVSVTRKTLVQALSEDPDYESLLHLFQRTRLIPTLNKLNGSTLFAPTNDAIKRHASKNRLWSLALQDDTHPLLDNIQEKLRQQLLYHILNYSLPAVPSGSAPQTLKTLHYPRTPQEPPSRDPPPNPPWMPIPGGTLGGEPQRLRIIARGEEGWVSVDAFGKGGVKIIKNHVDAGNGILYGIADVLSAPSDLAQVASQQSGLSYFARILTPEIIKTLNSSSEMTVFLPTDDAWNSLDHYERLYLESEFATDDLRRILNMHAVVQKSVVYSDSFQSSSNLTTIDGNKLEIVVSRGKTNVSWAKLVKPDIYASNGVLHLVDSLLAPPGALRLTPEKFLLALNCTTFISMLHSVNLTSLVNNTDTEITILAPKDDVLSVFGNGGLPEKGSNELKKALEYHFLPGKWRPKKLEHGMLLETRLEEEGLKGKQVLDVEVGYEGIMDRSTKSIKFSGARVIGDAVEVNNTVIYFISRPLAPPSDPFQTALPHLDLSSFLAAISSTSQGDILRNAPRTTFLIPHNAAFQRLGRLVSAHLLAASSKPDLEHVILHHVLDSVEYSKALQGGSQHSFATLEGSDVQIDRFKNGSIIISASGGWPGLKAELYPRNFLTNTGVVHELSDILIPRSVNLTIGKLVKAAEGNTMASIMIKAGFEWILNGTAPPQGSPWADQGVDGAAWTLLCPKDDAFKGINLTALYADINSLRDIASQHLILTSPVSLSSISGDGPLFNNLPLPLVDSVTYTTLRSGAASYGDIIFRNREDISGFVVGIKGTRGSDSKSADWARVLSWGRSTAGGGGGVIQIDKLVMPYYPSWWFAYGAPLSAGFVGCGLICMFFYGVRTLWRIDRTEATYEPVGGFGRDDHDEP